MLEGDGAAARDHPGARRGRTGVLGSASRAWISYRQRFPAAPDTLTNAILVGTLLAPLGLAGARSAAFPRIALERRVDLGILPMPRRDVERLHQILTMQSRLLDLRAPFKAQRSLLHRHVLNDALTWLEIHGERPDVLEHWRALQAEPAARARRCPMRRTPATWRRSSAAAAGAGDDAGALPAPRE